MCNRQFQQWVTPQVMTVHAIPTMIAQSLRVSPAILSAKIHTSVLTAPAYALVETPQPVSAVPVPYESLLYMVLILVITSPPLITDGALCVKGSGSSG